MMDDEQKRLTIQAALGCTCKLVADGIVLRKTCTVHQRDWHTLARTNDYAAVDKTAVGYEV